MKVIFWKRFLESAKVRVISLSVVLILLSVSIFGLHDAYSSSVESEEKVTVLNYESEGEFEYLVYPDPQAILNPSLQSTETGEIYFTQLIDSVDLSFSYNLISIEPVKEFSEEVRIVAIIENPGSWKKELLLVYEPALTGAVTINFPLNLDAIDLAIQQAQDETGIVAKFPELIIQATVESTAVTVTGIFEDDFVASTRIKQGGGILEWDTELDSAQRGRFEDIFYWHQGRFDYTINLNPNTLIQSKTLKPVPSTLELPPHPLDSDSTLPVHFADWMDATFSYQFTSDRPVRNLNHEVKITGFLEDSEYGWSESFEMVSETMKAPDFTIIFPLDFKELNNLIQDAKDKMWLSSLSPKLTIEAEVHTTAKTDYEPIDKVFLQTISTDMGEPTLKWNGALTMSENGSIQEKVLVSDSGVKNQRTYLTIPVVIFALAFLYLAAHYSQPQSASISVIEQKARKAKKKYKDIIIDFEAIPEVKDEEVVMTTASLEDLINLSDSLLKPVVHKAPATPDEPHAYYVFDGLTRYEYLLIE